MKKIVSLILVCFILISNITNVRAIEKLSNNDKLDMIIDLIQKYSYGLEGKDILSEYLYKKIEQDPSIFTKLIDDILKTFSTYNSYTPPETAIAESLMVGDGYTGIGIVYRDFGIGYEVSEVLENSPAEKVGMKIGDIIVEIDGNKITNSKEDKVQMLVRGEEGKPVKIKIRRKGEYFTFDIIREKIVPLNVSHRLLSENQGYIIIESMGGEEDVKKFEEIWTSYAHNEIDNVIIDLRSNLGGVIDTAIKMINKTIGEEGKLFASLNYRQEDLGTVHYKSDGTGYYIDNVIVLVNSRTASASEFMAGALKDFGATIIGDEKTFGKGVGQYHISLADKSKIVLTTLELLLPKSGAYDGVGIMPDIVIENTVEPAFNYKLEKFDSTRNYEKGQSGPSILALTQRLKVLGYLDKETNVLGTREMNAIKNFQQENDLPVRSICDTQTSKLIEQKYKKLHDIYEVRDKQLEEALSLAQ